MLKNNRILLVLFLVNWIFSGCQPDYLKLNENFALWAVDTKSDMTLCYLEMGRFNVGVIGPCVYAAGNDKDFIILKVHPLKNNEVNKRVTNFYIIPLKPKILDSEAAKQAAIGPMSETKFLQKRAFLKVSDKLDFTISFWDI